MKKFKVTYHLDIYKCEVPIEAETIEEAKEKLLQQVDFGEFKDSLELWIDDKWMGWEEK